MFNLRNGVMAGFFATLVISMLMMVKTASGQFPELHVIRTLSDMMGVNLVIGAGIHMLIGSVVWGIAFAMLAGRLPGRSYLVKGIVFGVLAWLMMMSIFMPLAGAGFFAVERGTIVVPVMTLIYHLVFGAVLGTVYGGNMMPVKY
jgi:uncharacterized membrane protein YagU involved in acid resistance